MQWYLVCLLCFFLFFFQAEDGIRDLYVTGVQTCALPISRSAAAEAAAGRRGGPERGSECSPAEVGARAAGNASPEPELRVLSPDHGSHRILAGELRSHRPMAREGRSDARRFQRHAGGWHAHRRCPGPAPGAARPLGFIRDEREREAPDVRARTAD